MKKGPVKTGGWEVAVCKDQSDPFPVTHVWPLNDLRQHGGGVGRVMCWCNPTIEDDLVIHNAADGREAYERGLRKPN